MHTKFYLVPSYELENMQNASGNSNFVNIQKHQNAKDILNNKNIPDSKALALFDRNNKLITNTSKLEPKKFKVEDASVQTDTQPEKTFEKDADHDSYSFYSATSEDDAETGDTPQLIDASLEKVEGSLNRYQKPTELLQKPYLKNLPTKICFRSMKI